jgi:hypothetical protein
MGRRSSLLSVASMTTERTFLYHRHHVDVDHVVVNRQRRRRRRCRRQRRRSAVEDPKTFLLRPRRCDKNKLVCLYLASF